MTDLADKPDTKTSRALASLVPEERLQEALLRAVGFDKLSPEQRELALAIARNYDLDPMLRHIVLIDGKPYITRDGLLHVAHKSGRFDGIEVDQPTLDGGYWRTWCTVYRKDMVRPFRYPGRYPASGGNAKYNEEMAIKIAEVMTLRRAFDVAAPVLEERWDGDETDLPDVPQPTSLAERVSTMATAIVAPAPAPPEPEPEPVKPTKPVKPVKTEYPPVGTTEPSEEEVKQTDTGEIEPSGMNLADFAMATAGFSPDARDALRSLAKEMFPDARSFGTLSDQQREAIFIEAKSRQSDALAAASAKQGGVSPLRAVPADATQCEAVSPLSGATCDLAAGHDGRHRDGKIEAW